MGNALFPVFEMPELIPESSRYDYTYKRSVAWDPTKGDFVRDGANRLIECSGPKAYMAWCYKAVQTERFHCMAYPSEIGAEMEAALREPDEKAVESALERTITETLKVNPRTEYVRGFTFTWDGDRMRVSFVVKGIETEEFQIVI